MSEANTYGRFGLFHAATIYEAAGKSGDMQATIRPISLGSRLCGPAFTVRCWQGDGSAFMEAVDVAPPGSVLVIDSGAEAAAASWGGSATITAVKRGLAGVVTNGTVRDTHIIREMNFPVFCAGISVRGAKRTHAGAIGEKIAIAGVVVSPEDLIVGDDDGVVVVAHHLLEPVYKAAIRRKKHEDEADERLRAGEKYATVAGASKD